QEHAGSPAAIDGGSFKRRSKTYPAVAAGDRSAVVQDDVAAATAARADLDTGSAVAANPETWVRDAWTTRETVTTCSSVNSDASYSGAGIATNSASANSTSAASATSAAKSFTTTSAVTAAYRSEIQDFRVNDRRARSHPKAVAAIATNPVAAISVAAVTAVTAVAAITASSVAAIAARSENTAVAADRTATQLNSTYAAIAYAVSCSFNATISPARRS